MGGPITGRLGAFPNPGRWGRSDTGNFSTLVYHGSKAEVTNLAANFAQTLGLTYEVTESFGTFKLEIHLPWNFTANNAETDLVILWEMFANHSDKDLLQAQVEVPTIIGSLSQAQIQVIRQYLDNPPTYPSPIPVSVPDGKGGTQQSTVDAIVPLTIDFFKNLTPDPAGGNGTGNAANALSVYQLMVQGVRSHPVDQPILRRTIVTSQRYAVAMALTNLRKIISTTSLLSLEQVPNDSLFYDPGSGQLLLPQDVSANTALAYGWYKTFPTVQQIALLKWQVVQEWQYGLWATLVWGTPL
jgi:hypothetical protein